MVKEFKESMDRCIGRSDVTEITLKTALNAIQSIDQKCVANFFVKGLKNDNFTVDR